LDFADTSTPQGTCPTKLPVSVRKQAVAPDSQLQYAQFQPF
jgi:hypothetical protein